MKKWFGDHGRMQMKKWFRDAAPYLVWGISIFVFSLAIWTIFEDRQAEGPMVTMEACK